MGVRGQENARFEVKLKPGFAVHSLANNKFTVIGSGKDLVIVFNNSGSIAKKLEGTKGNVVDIDSDRLGEKILSSASNEAILWDTGSGKIIMRFTGHKKNILQGRIVSDNTVATIGEDNQLMVWNMESGEMIYAVEDHEKGLRAMDGRKGIIATGGKNGLVVIRDALKQEILAKMQLEQPISEIAIGLEAKKAYVGTSNGKLYFIDLEKGKTENIIDLNKGRINDLSLASDNQHLVISARSILIYDIRSMEQVREMNKVSSAVIAASFTPDGNSLFYMEEFAPKVECVDVSNIGIAYSVNVKDEDDKTPPQIYLASPAKMVDNRVVHYEDLLAIRGSVIDDYGVQNLKINGITTPVKSNGNFVINLPLSMGENFVTIEVTDINQNTALKKFIVTRKNLDGTAYDPSEATNYLLVIGINKYDHWPQLYNAVKDANDVVNTLLGMYGFEFANVTLITDKQATRSNLYKTLREFVSKVGPKDNFMIYYSGHGYFDELLNEGYWVPSDARINQTGDYLSNSDISKIIANIDSQHTFLVADACFSGSLFNESSRGYAENVEKFKSRWGLASGRLETVSDGDIGANSPFARSFIEYLKTNDKEKLAVSQLVQYVKIQVAEVSDQTPIGNPLKGVGDEGGEFIFYKKQ